MYGSKGRSGVGDHFTGKSWDESFGLSDNGRQWKNEHTGEQRNLAGADYWQQRKTLSPNHPAENIRWDSYKCPSYYHQPKQAKAVPIPEELFERMDVLIEKAEDNEKQQKKESIFLTLKEDNIFRKIYEKFIK